MRRRMVVAFEQIESPETRILRQAASGVWDGTRGRGLGHYWCAADKPSADVPVRAVHRTSTVPADAECERCHIGIRDLQEQLGALV